MSADYAARMRSLRQQHEGIAARRKALEKKLALREATTAEFSAVARQTAWQKVKKLRTAAVVAKARNDEFVRAVREAQRRMEETRLLVMDERSPSTATLAREKARYLRKIEQVFPAWQEKEQKLRVEKLRALEERKRKLERHRYLAKKTFEQEQTVEDLIRQTRHEIELAENLAQNEACERELLRQQNFNHASRIDETIREHAREARSFLQGRAAEQLLTIPEVDEETTDTLCDTFSPRNALQALREGASAVSIQMVGNEEQVGERRREINLSVASLRDSPSRLQAPLFNDPALDPNQQYAYVDDTGHGYVYYDVPDDARDDQSTHPLGVMEQSVQYPTQQSNGYARAHHLTPFSDQQQQPPADAVPPTTIAQNMPDNVTSRAFTDAIKRTDNEAPQSTLSRNSSAASASIAADQQQIAYSDSKSVSTWQIGVHGDFRNGASTCGTQLKNDNATSSESDSFSGNTKPSNPVAALMQLEGASNPKETGDSRAQEHRQIPESGATAFVISSGADTNPTDHRQAFKVVTQSTVNGDAIAAGFAIGTTPQLVIEEKPPASSLSFLSESLPSGPTSAKLSQDHGVRESVEAVVVSVSDTVHKATPANPADSVMSKSSSEQLVTSTTAMQSPHSADQVVPVSSPMPIVQVCDKNPRDMHPDSSLVASVDSSGLSPLTSLDLSGSFFRDVDTKTYLQASPPSTQAPDPTLAVRGISLEVAPPSIYSSEYESKLPQPQPEEKAELGAIPPTTTFLERHTETTNESKTAESTVFFGEMAKQEAPCQLAQQGTVAEERNDTTAETPAEIGLRSDPAVTDCPTPHHTDDMIGKISEATVDAASPAVRDTVPATEIQTSTTATVASSIEEHENKPGTQHMSPSDRVKALGALIARVEEGAAEGDRLGESMDSGASSESKRELVRMAVGGRKAQIAFYGSDICFELILDIARDVGPALFPSKAFEGIMNDQKLRKLHQQSKDKEMELWRLLSAHLKQLVGLKAIGTTDLVEMFLAAFLSHDPDNQRSQRKMREFLFATCGATPSASPSQKDSSATPTASPNRFDAAPSPEPAKTPLSHHEPKQQDARIETPSLLQTAFLQHQSPPKSKTFGIATAGGYKKKSGRDEDFLSSMSSTPTRLSQKLIKGGKLGDYSEFEEEEEVDLQNLIGSRSARSLGGSASGRSGPAPAPSPVASKGFAAAARREDADFDVDF